MIRLVLLAGLLLVVALVPTSCRRDAIKVGSKKFTESVILGEITTGLIESAGEKAIHYRELGGTQLVFEALRQGDVDVYPEYTGTIQQEILSGDTLASGNDLAAIRSALQPMGVEMSEPLGFNNTYALAMRRERAEALQVSTISDLVRHPDLSFGFSNEFLDRADGWRNLQSHYDLPQRDVTGLDHDLAYRQLQLGAIDVIDAYSTDAKIEVLDLKLLQDDLQYFPRYDAVLLYREELSSRFPHVMEAMLRLEKRIDGPSMTRANRQVEVDRMSESQAAAEFLERELDVEMKARRSSRWQRIVRRTGEHLDLVRRSLIPAILIAVPLGIVAAKQRRAGQFVLAAVGIVQTIPALALLVILMPVVSQFGLASVGLGSVTAIAALLLYSLLPIVRNTHAGLCQIDPAHRESALALGLSPKFRLLRIELPLASPNILAGIKTAAVINVGFATLGALIGAGGYGQPIITGIRLNDTGLILEGAVPAALLAIAAQVLFEVAERWLVPRGLRLPASR